MRPKSPSSVACAGCKLLSLPGQRRPGQRGRRVYGTQQYSLAKRAGSSRLASITYRARKQTVTHCKTFGYLTLVRGVMRSGHRRYEDAAWAANFSTDTNLSIGNPGSRGRPLVYRESFHDTKEVWGAGQQQVRRLGARSAAGT